MSNHDFKPHVVIVGGGLPVSLELSENQNSISIADARETTTPTGELK